MKRLYILVAVLALASCSGDSPSSPPGAVEPHWQKSSGNPVLRKGDYPTFDFIAVSDCWVMHHEGLYKMWYTGGGAVLPDTMLHASIGYATSTNGLTWSKYPGNPVLDIDHTAWDSLGVETVTVLVDSAAPPAQRYKLWYAGQTLNEVAYELGYAYSPDGITWAKHPDPVIRLGDSAEWDNMFLEGPSVLLDNGVYKMWYAAYDGTVDGSPTDGRVAIGYATSPDGITWTKFAGNPVMVGTRGEWDEVYVQDPHVLKMGSIYHMWYGGVDHPDNFGQEVGYAWSTDGIIWTKGSRNPVLTRGTAGAWDANLASFPAVVLHDGALRMWYTGKDVEPLPEWPTPYYWELGYAQRELGIDSLYE